MDVVASDVVASDAVADSNVRELEGGLAPVTLDRAIDLDPCPDESCTGGRDAQIHGAAAFDGLGVWVVYSATRNASRLFDVLATRIGLDGQVLVPPVVLNTSAGNSIDPDLAIDESGNVLVAWTTDDGNGGDSNLQIHYRTMSREGSIGGRSDSTLRSRAMGMPLTRNHAVQSVAAGPSGFVIAGIRAIPEAMSFQAFAQQLPANGDPTEDAVSALEATTSQGPSSATVASMNRLRFAFERGDTNPNVLIAGTGLVTPANAAPMGASPFIAADSQATLLAFTEGGYVRVSNVSEPTRVNVLGRIGTTGTNHAPRLAMDRAGGAGLVFFRLISGSRNQVWAARIRPPGAVTAVTSTRMLLGAPGAPAYAPGITHIAGDIFFVLWSEGSNSPHFRLRGRFIELSSR